MHNRKRFMSEQNSARESKSENGQTGERFRALVEGAPGGILLVNQNGIIVLVNERMETLFGYTRTELIGSTIEMLLPERFRQSHIAYRTGYFTSPSARPMGMGRDLAGRRKDGSEFPVEIGLSYTPTDNGILTLAFITDITERKSAEEALRHSEER